MRLVFSVTNDLVYDQRMQRICATLAEAGHEVTLVGRLRRSSPELTSTKYQQVRLFCWFERGKLFYLEYNLRLLWWLLWHSFEVYTGIDLDTLLPNLFVARIKGKKCFYDAHEYFTEVPEVVDRPFTKSIWEIVARFAIPRVDKAYTVGPALAQIFQDRYGIPFQVVRNVPLRSGHQPVQKPVQPIILYQGVLNVGRGLETAIAAMQHIEGAELWLAGEGNLSVALRQLAKDLQLDTKVKFLGYIPPHDLRNITNKAYIGLNLLENRGQSYYYSLANKAFDYIQSAVPSIQMNFPEYLALQTEYRVFYLLQNLAIEPLVVAIQRLLTDDELYLNLQSECQKAAEIWCWDKEQEKLKLIYKK
jgi:glycosyltransferase involved in cell wall biosynthesis